MFNPSQRSKMTLREKMKTLEEVGTQVKKCEKCSLCGSRTIPIAGKFQEPTDAVLISISPHALEDKSGVLLSDGREAALQKFFSAVKPSLDLSKLNLTTAYKCFGDNPNNTECLSYLNRQLEILDPLLIVTLGDDVLKLLSHRDDLELGRPYATGEGNQHVLFGLMHPRLVTADKTKNLPIWVNHLTALAAFASNYDLKIFR